MYTCPHCSAATISSWRKTNSSPLFPARCRNCGGESVSSGWSRAITAFGAESLLWGSFAFALAVGSLYGLLLLPVGMFALVLVTNRVFPLVAVDAAFSAARLRAKKRFWIIAAALLVVLISWDAWRS
jgi:hypothetical protein